MLSHIGIDWVEIGLRQKRQEKPDYREKNQLIIFPFSGGINQKKEQYEYSYYCLGVNKLKQFVTVLHMQIKGQQLESCIISYSRKESRHPLKYRSRVGMMQQES